MRGWRGGAAALLVAAVLLPAPLLLKRRAAAPADEWRRADFDRALDRALAGADDEDLDRALAPRRRLADGDPLPAQVECSVVTFAYKKDISTSGTAGGGWKRVAAADIDGDGDAADLVSADWSTHKLWWFENDMAGTFTAAEAYSNNQVLKKPMDVATGDIDDNDTVDIVTAGQTKDEILWFKTSHNADGSTSFTYNTIDKTLTDARSVFVADVDGDSLLDVVSASVSNEVVKWYKAAHEVGDDVDDPSTDVLWTAYTIDAAYHDRFDDDGGASPIEVQAVKVVVADLDGDDKLDVLYADDKTGVVGWSAQPAGVTSAADWGSSLTIDYDATNKAKWVVAADFDGDDNVDVVAATTTGTILLYENLGGSPVTWTEKTPLCSSSCPAVVSVEVFDIDGDQDLDVLASVEDADEIRWWKNNGNWAFASYEAVEDRAVDDDFTINKAGGYLTAVDLDADGDLDVVSAHDSYITWYENDCTIAPTPAPSPRPSFSPRPTHSFNPTPRPSVSFNPTPRPTFRPTNKQFHCESNVFGIPHIIDQPDSSTGYNGAYGCNSIFAIDVDGDFDVDFVAGNAGDNAVAWYANDGYEDFTKYSITDSSQASTYQASNAKDVFAIDVDGDGDVDVLSASFDDDKIAW